MNLEDSIVEKLKLLMEYYPVAFYDLVLAARAKNDNHNVMISTRSVFESNDSYKDFVGNSGNNMLDESIIKTVAGRVRGKGVRLRIIDAGEK